MQPVPLTLHHPLRRAALALCAAALLPALGTLTSTPAQAQTGDWPNAKPITYVVPFTAGGSTDIIGRTIANKLQESLKQAVVVENKPGQAGGIGASFAAKAAPDGYTLFGGTISTHAINASLYKNLSYHPVKDFEPVALVATLPNVLIINPSLGVNTVAELIALLKKDPSKRMFASSGAGTSTHLAGEMFGDLIGVKLTHIPYKGTPPALTDVAAGQVTFMFDQMTAALPLAKAGRVKLLAVTTGKRITLAPELPTMIESGVPGFEMSSWQAIYAPKGTPKAIVQKLNAEIVKALKLPDVQAKLHDQLGMNIVGSTPEELAAHMDKEIPRWADLVKKSGATPD
ncbi:tripartite tricarboxylate transporter substrate binding protein [Acidovorax sp. 106]|uniref:Bug family tripartite tricarboxylate transporter substrate binding protein n=1 Tax=Acidovorax sp. 106 TaxID=2135637 RepID=UPI000EABCA02|nr:tripartite tricarboxylate transporter substrate binding protein [Acidovorax sp. 106]RLJ37340.1 tripartite-type tricarboxylate transporter receptor subunit TctC [Acidovorax sp. 106]